MTRTPAALLALAFALAAPATHAASPRVEALLARMTPDEAGTRAWARRM